MLADVIEGPEVEHEAHRTPVTVPEQWLDVGLEAHGAVDSIVDSLRSRPGRIR